MGENKVNQKLLTEDEIFRIAFQIPTPEARLEYLKQVCQGDAEVERIVALLKEGDPDASFLEKGPRPLAATADSTQGLSGKTIGPYKLLQEIGEGGFGVVYMAEQVSPVRRKVALKIIKPGMDTKQVVARFEAERQALAMMDHPNIAKILDGGETDDGPPYFVMELVKGVPLTDFCDSNKLSTHERLTLFATICLAVQHAHQKGVIHRDLKPSNVMVTLHDNRPVPKIIDFGVSKAISQQLTEKTLFTVYGQMVGTPVYMSPEQAQMSGLDIDTRSDIYSLGVLLYELLTGTTPLDATRLRGTAYAEMQRLILEAELPKPSTRLSTLGDQLPIITKQRSTDARQLGQFLRGDLDWIVMKAIEKERNRRYDTAGNFAADIQRFLENEEIEARPPSVSYRMQKFFRRNKGPVIAGSLILVTLFLGIIGTTVGMLRAKRDAARNRQLTVAANESAASEREAKSAAQRAAKVAQDAKGDLSEQNYFQLINLAHGEMNKGRPAAALALLDDCPPDLRHWEWNYLYRLACSKRNEPQEFVFDQNIVSFDWHSRSSNSAVVLTLDGTLSKVSVNEDEVAVRPFVKEVTYQDESRVETVDDVEFSPDGNMFAVSLGTNGAQVFNSKTGNVIAERSDSVSCLAFHPDPRKHQLAVVGHDQVVRIWDLDDKERSRELIREESWWISDTQFSSDAKWIVTGNNAQVVSIYSAETGELKQTLKGQGGPVWTLAISHDGRLLATGGSRSNISLWDLTTGTKKREFQGHTFFVDSVEFSADDSRLVSLGRDGTVRLWQVETGREILTLQTPWTLTHRNKLAFSQDGSRLAASCDNSLVVWDASEQPKLATPMTSFDLGAYSSDVEFMEDEQVLACSTRQGVVLWDLQANQPRPVDFKGRMTSDLDVHSNGRDLAIVIPSWGEDADRFRQLVIWDSVTGEVINQTKKTLELMTFVSIQPQGKWLVTTSPGFGSRIWDLEVPLDQQDGRLIPSIGWVTFSRCGRYLAGISSQKVWLWNESELETLDGGRLLYQPNAPFGTFTAAGFSPGGDQMAFGDLNGNITVLSTQENPDREAITWKVTSDMVRDLSFTRDGRYLATFARDDAIRIWDLEHRQEDRGNSHPKLVQVFIGKGDLEFSKDGRRLVSAGETVDIWDTSFLYP
ncbi:MAG: protein kinase [Planctomycetales bacterium]|nr:protein kinase [Planctomycetales bacterium]